LKNETIKYCNLDVKLLYDILIKFNDFIFDQFRLNITSYPTLPSLSLAIFRSKFLNDYKIPIITGNMYQDMRNSFTGGSVDVFKSYGENLYHYDVNSLYPYIMKNYKFPVGSPVYFEGNILDERLNYNKPFGIFEAEIITPENLNIPLLQTRFSTSNCIKTISPLGK
jgi:hypothetical protein